MFFGKALAILHLETEAVFEDGWSSWLGVSLGWVWKEKFQNQMKQSLNSGLPSLVTAICKDSSASRKSQLPVLQWKLRQSCMLSTGLLQGVKDRPCRHPHRFSELATSSKVWVVQVWPVSVFGLMSSTFEDSCGCLLSGVFRMTEQIVSSGLCHGRSELLRSLSCYLQTWTIT